MKKTFPGYYRLTPEEFADLWDSCLFALDANVLLDVYRYTPQTRKEMLAILGKVTDRLWIPHQAGLEYQKQRINVIVAQSRAYKRVQELLNNYLNKLKDEFSPYRRHPFLDVSSFLARIDELFQSIIKEIEQAQQAHPDWISDDAIHCELANLLTGKVGAPYSEAQLAAIYKSGEQRYGAKIPPGYEDNRKLGNEKYGDLILWQELIDRCKETQKPIVFITGDSKKDWWQQTDDGKTIGPQPELIDEMHIKAGQRFYMYQTDRFVELAPQYLKGQANQEAIKEIREVRALAEVQPWYTTSERLRQIWAQIDQTTGSLPAINRAIETVAQFGQQLALSTEGYQQTMALVGQLSNQLTHDYRQMLESMRPTTFTAQNYLQTLKPIQLGGAATQTTEQVDQQDSQPGKHPESTNGQEEQKSPGDERDAKNKEAEM